MTGECCLMTSPAVAPGSRFGVDWYHSERQCKSVLTKVEVSINYPTLRDSVLTAAYRKCFVLLMKAPTLTKNFFVNIPAIPSAGPWRYRVIANVSLIRVMFETFIHFIKSLKREWFHPTDALSSPSVDICRTKLLPIPVESKSIQLDSWMNKTKRSLICFKSNRAGKWICRRTSRVEANHLYKSSDELWELMTLHVANR